MAKIGSPYPKVRFWRADNVTMFEIVQAKDRQNFLWGDGDVIRREARPEDRDAHPAAWEEFVQSQQPKKAARL